MPILALLMLLLGLPGAALAQDTPRDAPSPAREAVVANETEQVMQEIYLYPAGAGELGPDRLGNAVLPPRATLRLVLPRGQACNYEVRVLFEDGNEDRRRLDVCRAGPRVNFTEGGPRREVGVVNDADVELRELYVFAPGRAGDAGPDRLGSRTLPAGETLALRLRGLADCVVELRAVFADDSEVRRARVDVCRQPRLAFGDPALPLREARLSNKARVAVREVFVRPVGQEGWGADRLGAAILEPRASLTLRLRQAGCRFDLRAVYENDRDETLSGRDLCASPAVELSGPTSGEVRRLALVNGHARPVTQVYVAGLEPDDWGDDLLAGGALAPEARRELRLQAGCTVALRVVFDTDAAEERRGIDLCRFNQVRLRPGWTLAERLDGEPPPPPPPPPPEPESVP